jgi:hypothetical protein
MSNNTIAFFYENPTMDQAEYDKLATEIGRGPIDSPAPAGRLAHLSGAMADGGWRVIDVWESEEAANAHYSSRQFHPVDETTGAAKVTPWPLYRTEIDHAERDL